MEKDVLFNFLLLLDSTLGHPSCMDDLHPKVKVMYLPWNTTLLIQHMDQEVIATFRKYYLCHTLGQAINVSDESRTTLQQFWKDCNIYKGTKNSDFAWCEFTVVTMNVFWKNLYLQFFHDFHGFEDMDEESKDVISNSLIFSE